MGHAVTKICHDIFNTQKLPSDINKTFLCLIPKIPNANNIKKFRPIGLCNTIYKVITKILANRIKPFLEKIISPFQTSFMQNRRASDNALTIQELVSNLRKLQGKEGHMLIKIDLEKAFDRIEWSFIYRALRFFNFPPKFTRLLMNCITPSSIAVLVNGSTTSFF